MTSLPADAAPLVRGAPQAGKPFLEHPRGFVAPGLVFLPAVAWNSYLAWSEYLEPGHAPTVLAESRAPLRGVLVFVSLFGFNFLGQALSIFTASARARSRGEEFHRAHCGDVVLSRWDRAMENLKEQSIPLGCALLLLAHSPGDGELWRLGSPLLATWCAIRCAYPFLSRPRSGLHGFVTLPCYAVLLATMGCAVAGVLGK